MRDGVWTDTSFDPDAMGLERDSCLLVLLGVPARAQPDLQATAAEAVERSELLGQECGVPQVDVEHERPDA